MSEFLVTALSLTPFQSSWQQIFDGIGTTLSERLRLPADVPETGRLLTVSAQDRRITDGKPFGLLEPIPAEPVDVEFWRSMIAVVHIGNRQERVSFRVREAGSDEFHVELSFRTRVYMNVFNSDMNFRDFNEAAKSDLTCLFTNATRELRAQGFGYRKADEDNLFGSISLESLREYVEAGDGWYQNPLHLRIAGIDSAHVDENDFEYDESDKPFHYRQDGFYFYDMVWPQG